MVPKMTPMATDEYLGIVYGLVNDKQLHDSNSVLHHCMAYLKVFLHITGTEKSFIQIISNMNLKSKQIFLKIRLKAN